MVLIGIYISIASAFCVLAMVLDLFYGFRNKKFWFPCKYFSLNTASITVIAVVMKLPVDLSSNMPTMMDQTAKLGGLAFMCTMMSSFMPSLASMDNKSLLANVIGLSILVITLIANIFIQVKTQVISAYTFDIHLIYIVPSSPMVATCIYMGMLLFLQMILISLAITIQPQKKF
ncbi:hypothetical protein HanPI659440_Chr06g0233271 [Helianthus annuus]|nr:hypothetical protein HanPI659440_Chr06g0233271 [Helianthus annuus]